MQKDLVVALKGLPMGLLEFVIAIINLPKRIAEELSKVTLENGHYYLQQYCVLEVIVMGILLFMFYQHSTFIITEWRDLKELSDLQFGAICGTPLIVWPLINKVWDSLNSTLSEGHKPSE